MNRSRREFTKLMGAAALAPLAPPLRSAAAPALSIWEQAEMDVQQTGTVSKEVALMLLDNQGSRSVYDDPKEMDELRAALARKVRDHKVIRSFPLGPEVEPILTFEA